MNVILFHTVSNFNQQNTLPDFVYDCVKQIRIFNPNVKVYLLTNVQLNDIDCDVVDINKFNIPNRGNFWTVTSERFFYIEHFIKENDLKDIIHFENDVLIYMNFSEVKRIKELNFCVTNGGDDRMMTGFMYCKDYETFKGFVDTIRNKNFGVKANDMFFLKDYYKQGKIDTIPILPYGEHSKHIEKFNNAIFDCASWGQYLGGTFHKKTPGFMDPKHYIGAELIAGKVDAYFEEVNGLKIPFCVNKETGEKYRINNLHIHSKNLRPYLSK